MTDQISQSDIDEFVCDLAATHPEYTAEQFKNDFKAVILREPKFAEIKAFQKAVLNCKSLKGGDAVSRSSIASASINPLPGINSQVINGYKFENKIGEGSFGEVWKVRKDGRVYALKITKVFKDEDFEVMFASSLKLTCKFLVKYHDAFVYGGKNFCVMDYCPQGDLRGLLKKQNKQKAEMLPIQRIMKILIQLYLGLYELHGKYIVHRDIKLENIFINDNDDIQLGDFGLGRMLDDTEGKASTTLGTPAYMAPELFVDNPSYGAKVDIWALGVTAYQLCTLELPFKGNKYELAGIIKKGKYTPISRNAYPVTVCEMINSMLQLIPDMRPSALDLLQLPLVQEFATELQLLEAFPSQARMQKAATNFPFAKVTSGIRAPVVNTPGYAFRVECKGGRYGYGKQNADCERVCVGLEKSSVILYSSERGKNTISIDKRNIIKMEFMTCTVTSIGNNFLSDFTYLTTPPTIPNTVTSIGNSFLAHCKSLTTPPTIPNTVTSIGNSFLSDCTSLITPPTIPNTVTSIGNWFLSYCRSLTTPPTIPNTVTSIGNSFLFHCPSLTTPPTISNTVTSISDDFLSHCTSLNTPPTIPNTVTRIGNYFLSSCTYLTTPPAIPNTVTSIGNGFLSYCRSLTTPPTIPNMVTSIGNYFLSSCTYLITPPTIPNTVTTIGDSFLSYCESLTTPPTIPNTVTTIGNSFLSHCESLTTPPTIPNTVTSIGNDFLYHCASLTTPPIIPNTVTSIGDDFLSHCTSLTTPPTIPNTVTRIGKYFLSECKSLTTPPTIPNTVTSIGGGFLSGCTLLDKKKPK